ncbi:hypothetical protein DL93DRAFT_2073314 [Clavulina sp. PMI_390]|nr:hypothetical protein DL93DRAFT_2073314 [Clavulina sp. PMI_390]
MPSHVYIRSSKAKGKDKKEDSEDQTLAVPEHPLRTHSPYTPTFASSFDGTLTRPNLRRQLRTATPFENATIGETSPLTRSGLHISSRDSADGSVGGDDWTTTPGASSSGASTPPEHRTQASDATREVIVHEVLPTDSLAGVALTYGVKIAALRKANKMWPSDSIHLRKVLYIPVDWQKWPKNHKPNAVVPIMEVEELTLGRSIPPFGSNNGSLASNNSDSQSITTISPPRPLHSNQPQTQRIPASQLSFFPAPPTLINTSHPPFLPTSSDPSMPTSLTLPRFSLNRKTTTTIFDVFSSSISKVARASTDSLTPSRTSMSEDGMNGAVSDDVVELDTVQDTWRTTPSRPRSQTIQSINNGNSSNNHKGKRKMSTSPEPVSPTVSRRRGGDAGSVSAISPIRPRRVEKIDDRLKNLVSAALRPADAKGMNRLNMETSSSESEVELARRPGVTTRQPGNVQPMSLPSSSTPSHSTVI